MRRLGVIDFNRIMFPHFIGGLAFIAVFAYQLGVVLPARPSEPDPAFGYTIAAEFNDQAVYVSSWDIALLAANFVTLLTVVLSGLWRVHKAQASLNGSEGQS